MRILNPLLPALLTTCSTTTTAGASKLTPNIFSTALKASSTTAFLTTMTNISNTSSRLGTTSLSAKASLSTRELPKAISVPPGTSPTESQPIRNAIDSKSTVLIVGATRGIGLEFVKQCQKKGAKVYGTYRTDPQPLLDLNNDEGTDGVGIVEPIQMDIADETSIEKAATDLVNTKEEGFKFTHIIHSAGIYLPETSFDGMSRGPRDAAPKVTKNAMMETFAINTIGPLLVAQNFVPLLASSSNDEEGDDDDDDSIPIFAILSSKVGSVDDNGSGGAYAYRSSKSALNNIAKSLSVDLAGEVGVILLHPGYVRTDMTGGKGLIDMDESVSGMLKAVECTDRNVGFRFVDYKACLIPW